MLKSKLMSFIYIGMHKLHTTTCTYHQLSVFSLLGPSASALRNGFNNDDKKSSDHFMVLSIKYTRFSNFIVVVFFVPATWIYHGRWIFIIPTLLLRMREKTRSKTKNHFNKLLFHWFGTQEKDDIFLCSRAQFQPVKYLCALQRTSFSRMSNFFLYLSRT